MQREITAFNSEGEGEKALRKIKDINLMRIERNNKINIKIT